MKSKYFLAGFLAMLFAGCQTDILEEEPVIPAVTGEEITFGSSLTVTEIDTKTIYADEPTEGGDGKSYYKVSWEDGDQIAIYCPQSPSNTLVNYKVTPQVQDKDYGDGVKGDASKSLAVTKTNSDEPGLQWGVGEGENGTHHFYAFYPASAVTGTEDGKIKGTIPVVQDPVKWEKKSNDNGGITYTGVANTDYAFMWAYCSHDKTDGGDVALTFHPWVTILDIEIKGPSQGQQKMSSVQIRSLNNTTLTGDFICDMTPVEENTGNAPKYTPVDMGSEVRNQITVRLYDNEEDDYISLSPNDRIIVRVYLLPRDYDYNTGDGSQELQIRVAPFNRGVLTRTLNGQGGQVTGGILAHKVNKVTLPALTESGDNYWLSSLDPNIYVTELSLPGSKMSALTDANGSSVIYQDDDIATQFKNGIRAFIFQTGYKDDGYWEWFDYIYDYNLYVGVQNNRVGRLSDYIKQIAEGLTAAENAGKKNEYAFVLLSWSSAASEGPVIGDPDGDIWLGNAVAEEIKEMAEDSQYRIYIDGITPKTTIKDVAGKIIFKVNSEHGRLPDNADVPALFASWKSYYEPNGVEMRWGTNSEAEQSDLTWFYQEATTVGSGSEIGSIDKKKEYIEAMWNKSIEFYESNTDNSMWFMNDLGGSMGNNGSESTDGVNQLTEAIGPYATEYLFNRGTVNATLGIVYMNHATPDNPYTGNLIQTVINNNFSFQLRTASQSTSSYSIPARTSSDGWDE